jgi:hypothetical protein
MPAGSDGAPGVPGASGELTLPHTWRPFGARVAGVIFGAALIVVCVFAWFSFDPATRASFTIFQRSTLLFIGLLGFAAWFALVRSRVVATDDGLVVVNGYRRHEYEWAEIVAVHLPPGAPWLTLDLSDGTTTSALGIQGSDGARARTAVRQLRALLDR